MNQQHSSNVSSKRNKQKIIAASDMSQPSDLSTSRPVIAGVTVRLLAGMYDLLLIMALIFVVGVVLIVIGTQHYTTATGAATVLPDGYRYGVMFPAFMLAIWGFYAVFWRKAGQTLGMQTWRLKTMTPTGDYLTLMQSAKRCLAACVLPSISALIAYLVHHTPVALAFSFVTGFLLNYALALFNDKHLAAHDILSGTLTVRMPAAKQTATRWGWLGKIKKQ